MPGLQRMQSVELHRQRLLLLRVSLAEQQDLLEWSTGSRVALKFCNTDAQFLEATRQRELLSGLIWEASRRMPPRNVSIARAVLDKPPAAPILVRMDLSQAATNEIAELARAAAGPIEWAVSLIGFDDFSVDIAKLADTRCATGGATTAIINAVIPSVAPAIRDIVSAAVIVGRARTSVRELARRCGRHEAALRGQLKRFGAPSPLRLLGSSLLLHTAWRMEVEGLSPKQTAWAGGYSGSSPWNAMSEYVLRRSGIRLRRLRKEAPFPDLLNAFVKSFGVS